MTRNTGRHFSLLLLAIAFASLPFSSGRVSAQSAVRLNRYDAMVDIFEDGSSVFEMAGVASHLGNFNAFGEAEFVEGPVAGSMVGSGVVVFEAANGDLLVGVTELVLSPPGADDILDTRVHFSWRDSVVLDNGTVVANTGRFVDSRPPGLVVVDRYCCRTICIPLVGCFTRCEKCTTR